MSGLAADERTRVRGLLGRRVAQGGRENAFFGSRIVFAPGNTRRFLLSSAKKHGPNNHRSVKAICAARSGRDAREGSGPIGIFLVPGTNSTPAGE